MRFLTIPEVARLMRCAPDTIRRAIAAGSFPAVKLGRNYRVPRDRFLHWMEAQCPGSAGNRTELDQPELELADAPAPIEPTPEQVFLTCADAAIRYLCREGTGFGTEDVWMLMRNPESVPMPAAVPEVDPRLMGEAMRTAHKAGLIEPSALFAAVNGRHVRVWLPVREDLAPFCPFCGNPLSAEAVEQARRRAILAAIGRGLERSRAGEGGTRNVVAL